MRTMRALLPAMAVIIPALLTAQTIGDFQVGKIYDRSQTGSGGSTAGATPYGFFADVQGTGLSGTYTVTATGGSMGGAQTLTGGATDRTYEDDSAYADITALNNAYNSGNHVMAVPNSVGGAQSVVLNLSGDAFPNSFSITNGTWSGGRLLLNPNQDYTLTFDAFSGFSTGDFIELSIDSGPTLKSTSAVTQFLVGGGTISLAPGQTTSAELVFVNVVDSDTSTIAGSAGHALYATIVSFQIQAIPEPSTYAAILGALALTGAIIRRRRAA